MQIKLFSEDTQRELEEEVNRFILNKKIINISYSVTPEEIRARSNDWNVTHYGDVYKYCCCVLYE